MSPSETFRGKKVRNLRITFKGGAVESITADEGADLLNGYFGQLDDDSKKLSLINVGLNPESRPLKGSDYISWEMSGVPTVQVGNSQWAGCPTGGEGGYAVHQLGSTLAAGDVEVVRDGALALN